MHVAEMVPRAGCEAHASSAICGALDAYVCRLGAAHSASARSLAVPLAGNCASWWKRLMGSDSPAPWWAADGARPELFEHEGPGAWGRFLDGAVCRDDRLMCRVAQAAAILARAEAGLQAQRGVGEVSTSSAQAEAERRVHAAVRSARDAVSKAEADAKQAEEALGIARQLPMVGFAYVKHPQEGQLAEGELIGLNDPMFATHMAAVEGVFSHHPSNSYPNPSVALA
jgi:hypothetical protein